MGERGQFVAAVAKLKLAFSLLEQAAKITLTGPVLRLRGQLEELLRRAEDAVSRGRHQEAQRVLTEAKKNRDKAEQAVKAVQIDRAAEHYRVGISLAKRAIDMVSQDGRVDVDVISDERAKFERLLDRAREVVDESRNERATQILHQAVGLAKSAEDAYRNRNLNLAKKLLNQSSLLLLRAMDLASAGSSSAIDQSRTALFRLRDDLERAQPAIDQSRNPRARVLYERARRFAGDAQRALRKGRSYAALWKTDIGMNMLARAQRLARREGSPRFANRINQEINSTREDIEQVRGTLTPDSPADAAILLKMSQFALGKAEQAAAAGFRRVALEAILASQRFLTRAEKIIDSKDDRDVEQEQVRIRLNQLDAAIAEAEERLDGPPESWSRQLLQGAREFRRLSRTSFDQGNYKAANEGIQVSFELLRKSMKRAPKQ